MKIKALEIREIRSWHPRDKNSGRYLQIAGNQLFLFEEGGCVSITLESKQEAKEIVLAVNKVQSNGWSATEVLDSLRVVYDNRGEPYVSGVTIELLESEISAFIPGGDINSFCKYLMEGFNEATKES